MRSKRYGSPKEDHAAKAGLFNQYTQEFRGRVDTLVKHVLVLSSSALGISVGAFLGGTPPKLSPSLLDLLKWAWRSLTLSIFLCLTLMLLLLIGHAYVSGKWMGLIESGATRPLKVINVPRPMRLLNWIIGVAGLLFCILGIGLITYVAHAYISSISS